MKALRFYGPRDLRVEDVPQPEVGPGDVLVEVEVALAGASEARAFKTRHVLAGPEPFGRELCGHALDTGRRVVAAACAPCGHCAPCQAGRVPLCRRASRLEGAFAELALVPARIAELNLHPVPAALPGELAALVDPLADCLHAVERAELRPGSLIAVLGTGPIGFMLCACGGRRGRLACSSRRPRRAAPAGCRVRGPAG